MPTAPMRLAIAGVLVAVTAGVTPAQPPRSAPSAAAVAQNRRPRGVQVMGLTGPWPDGGVIPFRYSQAGEELSPALSWSGVPEGVASFTLIVHDLDAATGDGTDDVLHWMVWNIPGSATGLPEGLAQGATLPDGSRQISVSGPYYRGPGAPASGPPHHYAFELYALDAPLAVPDTGPSPAATRAAVVAAMVGHIHGKAVFLGRFKRGL
ncbi:MAG: YbhB/YbcL family Raf kinase inhibitor-like protein [Acidobacteriota bacterium]|nr:YbhB/YbcL family Raf kinase inhibitor-like protein [Acidobacteriota bacterium]